MRRLKVHLSGDQTALFIACLLISPLVGVAIVTGVILRFV